MTPPSPRPCPRLPCACRAEQLPPCSSTRSDSYSRCPTELCLSPLLSFTPSAFGGSFNASGTAEEAKGHSSKPAACAALPAEVLLLSSKVREGKIYNLPCTSECCLRSRARALCQSCWSTAERTGKEGNDSCALVAPEQLLCPPEVAGAGTVEGAGNGDGLWADHGEEVWCGTCLGRLSPGLPGSRRDKDDAYGIQKDPPLCVCVCRCQSNSCLGKTEYELWLGSPVGTGE